MSAQEWLLPTDLEEAVNQGAISLAEAWELVDDRILRPDDPYPSHLLPAVRRLKLLAWSPEGRPRH